jgi:hypothetical protein
VYLLLVFLTMPTPGRARICGRLTNAADHLVAHRRVFEYAGPRTEKMACLPMNGERLDRKLQTLHTGNRVLTVRRVVSRSLTLPPSNCIDRRVSIHKAVVSGSARFTRDSGPDRAARRRFHVFPGSPVSSCILRLPRPIFSASRAVAEALAHCRAPSPGAFVPCTFLAAIEFAGIADFSSNRAATWTSGSCAPSTWRSLTQGVCFGLMFFPQSWPCQKHPSTNTATFALHPVKSGFGKAAVFASRSTRRRGGDWPGVVPKLRCRRQALVTLVAREAALRRPPRTRSIS